MITYNRKFNGIPFHRIGSFTNKECKTRADNYRKKGIRARVVQDRTNRNFSVLYVDSKQFDRSG